MAAEKIQLYYHRKEMHFKIIKHKLFWNNMITLFDTTVLFAQKVTLKDFGLG